MKHVHGSDSWDLHNHELSHKSGIEGINLAAIRAKVSPRTGSETSEDTSEVRLTASSKFMLTCTAPSTTTLNPLDTDSRQRLNSLKPAQAHNFFACCLWF